MFKKEILSLGLVIGIFSPIQFTFANDQQVSLAVDQTVFSLAAFPGEEIPLEINVGNLLDKEQLVAIDFSDLSIEENNQLKLLVDKNELFGMKDWLETEVKKKILLPKENQKINFKIRIPQDASVGSHYAGIFFRALPEIQGENFQDVLVGAQIGCYVLLNVRGEIKGTGKINDFQTPTIAKEKNDLKIEFENTGNIHYIPHGEISVVNILNGEKDKIEIKKHFVFPGKKYFFENNWEAKNIWGIYWAKVAVVDGEQKFHFSSRLIFGKFSFLWFVFFLPLIWLFIKRKRKKKSISIVSKKIES